MSRHKVASTSQQPTSHDAELVEVWGDRVRLRDLVICLLITAAFIVVACVIAIQLREDMLFWGMGGSVAGFIVSSLVVSTKRDVLITTDDPEPSGTLTVDDVLPSTDNDGSSRREGDANH